MYTVKEVAEKLGITKASAHYYVRVYVLAQQIGYRVDGRKRNCKLISEDGLSEIKRHVYRTNAWRTLDAVPNDLFVARLRAALHMA